MSSKNIEIGVLYPFKQLSGAFLLKNLKYFKNLFVQNHWSDLAQNRFVRFQKILDYKLYKLGHCDLHTQNGGHDSAKHIFVIFFR